MHTHYTYNDRFMSKPHSSIFLMFRKKSDLNIFSFQCADKHHFKQF